MDHTVAHFEQENRWMAASGFPPTTIHRGEHERLLEAWRAAFGRAQAGDLGPCRQLAAQVPDWFDQHAATMDAALANWMRRVGYVPEETSR
jgi:hemerythrin